jgi:hypothetical protein
MALHFPMSWILKRSASGGQWLRQHQPRHMPPAALVTADLNKNALPDSERGGVALDRGYVEVDVAATSRSKPTATRAPRWP